MKKLILIIALATTSITVFAHGGGLDKNGCHKETKTGTRHCH